MNRSRIHIAVLYLLLSSLSLLAISSLGGEGLLAPSVSQAQGIPSNIGIVLTPSTNAPIPGQEVTIRAESYTVDLSGSTIVWTIDGKEYSRGIGQKSITVIAPPSGKKLTIRITAITADGLPLANNLTLSSGEVDMVIESNGYVPPFFKGKNPLAYQNKIKIVALPHLANASGQAYDPRSLIYEWKRDWKSLPDQSGYGKQVLEIFGDIIPRPYTISVNVSSRDGQAYAERYIAIIPDSPRIIFYRDDPLYGPLYNTAQSSQILLGTAREATILAVPFGFNMPTSGLGDVRFNWSINSASRSEFSSSRSVTLRAPSDAGGTALINLSVQSDTNILQGANRSIRAIFAAPKSTPVDATFTSF